MLFISGLHDKLTFQTCDYPCHSSTNLKKYNFSKIASNSYHLTDDILTKNTIL